MRTGLPAAQNRSLRFDGDRKHARRFLLDEAGNPRKRAAGSATYNNSVDLPVHLLENFSRRRLVVIIGIGQILELPRHERGAISSYERLCRVDGSLHALGIRSSEDLRPEGAHDHDFLL